MEARQVRIAPRVASNTDLEACKKTATGSGKDDEDSEGSDDDSLDPPWARRTGMNAAAAFGVNLRAVFLVYIVAFTDSLGGTISTPILPFYAKEFHASYNEIGQLFSVYALAQMFALPILSRGSDKYGRRSMLLLSVLGTAVAGFWQGTAWTYSLLLASRICGGFWSGVSSVCQVYIVDVIPPELRADYMSYLISATQASVLFGPSIGAGLSVLGLNVPSLVQGGVSVVLLFVVYFHLPESPEWCRIHSPASPASPKPTPGGTKPKTEARPSKKEVGVGACTTAQIVLAFGSLSFFGMVSQMIIMSMFAVYVGSAFHLDSVKTGFTITLGALSSVGTNIWISPWALRRFGELGASILGFLLIAIGSLTIACPYVQLSIFGFMLAYQGLAMNNSAVATGAANLTDSVNRSTVMTGVRMLKSLGAVAGPMFSGALATHDVRWPFFAAAFTSLFGILVQLATVPMVRRVRYLLSKRKTVGAATALLDGEWQDEYGTQEEIWDLGSFVAELLSSRHYRWVTYNMQLKNYISDSFPELAIDSEEAHRAAYDRRRKIIREKKIVESHLSYEQLKKQYDKLKSEYDEMRRESRSRAPSADVVRKNSGNELRNARDQALCRQEMMKEW